MYCKLLWFVFWRSLWLAQQGQRLQPRQSLVLLPEFSGPLHCLGQQIHQQESSTNQVQCKPHIGNRCHMLLSGFFFSIMNYVSQKWMLVSLSWKTNDPHIFSVWHAQIHIFIFFFNIILDFSTILDFILFVFILLWWISHILVSRRGRKRRPTLESLWTCLKLRWARWLFDSLLKLAGETRPRHARCKMLSLNFHILSLLSGICT